MSDTNRTKLTFVEEGDWGVTPTTPVMVEIPRASSELEHSMERVVSSTIRNDRQTDASAHVATSAAGDITLELTAGTPIGLYEGALATDVVSLTSEGAVSADVDGQTILIGDADEYEIIANANLVRLSGSSTTPSNDGVYEVSTRSDFEEGVGGTITLKAGSIKSDEASGTLVVSVQYIRNGAVAKSYTFEESYDDIDQYRQFDGMSVDTMSTEFNSRQIITQSIALVGRRGAITQSSIAGSEEARAATDVLNATTGVGSIQFDGVTASADFANLTIETTNNLSERPVIANQYSAGLRYGRFGASGTFSVHFTDESMQDKFLGDEEASVRVIASTKKVSGGEYVVCWDLPRIVIDSDSVAVSGVDADCMEDVAYTALRSPTRGYMIQVDIINFDPVVEEDEPIVEP